MEVTDIYLQVVGISVKWALFGLGRAKFQFLLGSEAFYQSNIAQLSFYSLIIGPSR